MAENPFKNSPDPRFLYLTDALSEAAAKVRYVIDERQGLTVLYGDVGMGKSSLLRLLYGEYMARPDVRAVLIHTPDFDTGLGFLKAICDELGVARKRARVDQQAEFQRYLADQFDADRNVVLFVDEAQALRGRVLEVVRTLLNYETDSDKLIQVVLAGQLELRERLRDKSKRALRSRIFTSSLLGPLSPDAARDMIAFRLERAGAPNIFEPDAVDAVYRWTGGTPRSILKVSGVAYALAQADGGRVTAEMVDAVAPDAELDDER